MAVGGFPLVDLEVRRGQQSYNRDAFHGAAGVSLARDKGIAGDDGLETYLKHPIMVLNAGALAQAFDGSTVDDYRVRVIRKDNAKDDVAKAKELFGIYVNWRIGRGG